MVKSSCGRPAHLRHLAAPLALLLFALASGPTAALAGPAPLAQLSMSRSGGLIVVPVQVEGKSCKFILDTGMTFSAVDRTLRPRDAGRSQEGSAMTPAGLIDVQFNRAPKVTIAGLPLRSPMVLVMDMGKFSRAVGQDIKGFVGMDFLKDYTVQFDWSAATIRLYGSGQAATAWGPATAIQLANGVPVCRGSLVDDIDATFIVDTGCNLGGCLTKGLYAKVIRNQGSHPQRIYLTAAGGVSRSSQVHLESITVGAARARGLDFSSSQCNLLGLGFLTRQMVTLDVGAGKMYLKTAPAGDVAKVAQSPKARKKARLVQAAPVRR